MGLMKSLVEVTHDEGYGDSLLMHINHAFGGKDMRAERVVGPVALSVKIEPTNPSEAPNSSMSVKVEKPKRYRQFENAAEAASLWNTMLKFKKPAPGEEDSRYRVGFVTSDRVGIGLKNFGYWDAFNIFECLDGTPFGIEE